jgi:hypothetical protein
LRFAQFSGHLLSYYGMKGGVLWRSGGDMRESSR